MRARRLSPDEIEARRQHALAEAQAEGLVLERNNRASGYRYVTCNPQRHLRYGANPYSCSLGWFYTPEEAAVR
eukprot:949754-Pleurochrysis_carterae.AAC.1